MKNFTNNFKQFTSRLSARWLIMALMLLLGTSSAWAKRVYLEPRDWASDNAKFAVWHWGNGYSSCWSQLATNLDNGYYYVDINDSSTGHKWVRVNSSASESSWKQSTNWDDNKDRIWGQATSDATSDLYIITGYNSSCYGCGESKSTTKSYKLHGEFNSWTDVDFPAEINITTLKNYEFKVKEVISYNSTEIDAIYYGNNGTMDRGNCKGWTMSYSDGNCKITADAKGTYTFEFNESNKQVSVTYPTKCTAPSNVSISRVPSTNPCPGTEVTLEANVGEGDVESYSWSVNGTGWIINNNANTNQTCTFIAGTETGNISLTVSGCNSSDDATTSIEVKSRASKSDITVSNNEYTYDGTAKAATVKWNDNQSAEGITVTYNPTTPKDAGSYTINVTTSAHGELCASNGAITLDEELTISPKTPDANDFEYTDQKVTYNGNAYTANVTWKQSYDKTGDITVLYNNSTEKPTNVGTYTITVTSAASDNFNATAYAIEKGTLTIECAEITDVANNFELSKTSYNYGETAKPTVSLKQNSTLVQAGLGAITTKYYNSSDQEVANPTAVGTYTAKIAIAAGTGYCALNETTVGTFKITCPTPAQPQLTIAEGDKVKVCEGQPNTDGNITISNFNSYTDCKFYLGSVSNENEIKSNTVAVNNAETYTIIVENACGESSQSSIKIGADVLTPTLTDITIESSAALVCAGDNNVTLTCNLVGAVGTPTYKWTKNGEPVGDNSNTIEAGVLERNTTFSVSVILDNSGCTKEFTARKDIEVKARPNAPDLRSTGESICYGTLVNLPMVDNNDANNQINWYNGNKVNPTNLSVPETTTFYAEAVSENGSGCPSNDKTPYTVTVNPLPEIGSISGATSAVKYEDVELRANGVTEGAEVKWYLGDDVIPVATGTTYTITSETAGEVIVKAKAFLGGCESAEVSKKVTFSAEDCTPEVSNDIKITFKTPSNNGKDGQYWGLGTLYYKKDDGSSYTNVKLYEGTCEGGEQTSQEVTISNLQANATIYFKACYDYGGYTATTKKLTLTKGNKYIIGIISNENPSSTNSTNKTSEVGIEVTSKVSLTNGPEIKAPAVKMVSAEYDEVNDKIVAKGAVYKTGCGETFWGFQYSRNGQTWGTANVDFIHPSGNSLSVPGEFEYSFPIPGANGGETYYIRAYALNNYKGSYALSNAVYSTTSLPVEIPSKTIEYATILLVDSEGEESDVTEVCPQSTVYLKVSYKGGDFKNYEAADNFPGTNLELVNHDKAKNEAIFSYTATATGIPNITISNDNTSITTTNGVSITLKDVQVATPPTIYLEKNTICDNQTTNVVVNSPIVGFIYSLKNGSVGDPVTYERDDLKFEVSKEGSYTVQVQETVCGTTAISAPVDLRVITSDVKITLTTDVNTITPWQPLTLTVKAPSGYDYYLKGLDDETVYTKSGDVYTIKFRRPESWGVGNSKPDSEPETKTFIAGIKIGGEEDLCSTTTKEIQLVDTKEVCPAPGN